jgi:hypothetical protein
MKPSDREGTVRVYTFLDRTEADMGIPQSLLNCVVFLSTLVPLSAQWLSYPTPGIPRTPDGKPNLSAPAPKTADGKPDLSGIWETADMRHLPDLAVDGVEVPLQPWAAALYKERRENQGKGRPSERCLTHGVTDFDALAAPRKIMQTPGVIVVLFEAYNHYRQILMDGRPLPKPTQPAYMGYSVGKWEGDTLVVDTTGFNDKGWLDDLGHPQTEALHVTERYRRRDFGHMDLQLTIDDPKAYTKPWTVNLGLNYLPDEELIESICDNEKDAQHMVGK